jgi:hypothetical protein
MSETGVLSGIFGQLSEYSLSLNRFLVELKANAAAGRFAPPPEVRDLIARLGEQWHSELAIQALANALDSTAVAFDAQAVKRLQRAVTTGERYDQLLADLEGLAVLVRSQQSGAFSRLRHPA